ncbi:MAG: TolC family protein [Fusobacteriaceae bacterium]|nr:TolC family protein [Fusobacteriaceae bacterium]MBP6322382.1 TolC family protein [Fusobacteriaceae bacterium]MBP9510100.1 TolC family protein [Fusobacteriaceae bacterium]
MNKVIVLFLIIFQISFCDVVSIDKAISLGIDNNINIKVSEKQIEYSRYKLSSAFKEALPSIKYEGNYAAGEYTRDMGKDFNQNEKISYSQGLTLTQPLFRGGIIIGGINIAKLTLSKSFFEYLEEKKATRLEIIEIYSTILQNQRELKVYESSKAEMLKRYERQKVQLEMKIITKSDLLKTESTLSSTIADIIGLRSEIKVEKENLKTKIGFPKNLDIEVIEFTIPENLSKGINFKDDLQQAKTKSTRALIAKKNLEISTEEKNVSRGEMMPKIDAFTSYGNNAIEERDYDNSWENAEWRGGVAVSWNVFNFGKDYDNYKGATVQLEKEKLKDKDTQDNIELDLIRAYTDIIKIEEQKIAIYQRMIAAKESYFMDKHKYEANLISIVDFLTSENSSIKAEVEYNKILKDYYVAWEKYRTLLI